ncbi:ComEA family DNA-binding protein [Hoyosella rhizosphaerae]|nr:ComEA family DNA-binding protein [Hoyosella rhizosphaerae]MBN4928070.1 ComEA family DNA-binding protein [Hoyosella rhizosphaerae]
MPYDTDKARERYRALMSLPARQPTTGDATVGDDTSFADDPDSAAAARPVNNADAPDFFGETRRVPPIPARLSLTKAGALALIGVGIAGVVFAAVAAQRGGPSETQLALVQGDMKVETQPNHADQPSDPDQPSHPDQHGGHRESLDGTKSDADTKNLSMSAEPPEHIVVSVAGHIHTPGLVTLPAGARVADAIAHAGGSQLGADTITLNLAHIVQDGDHIVVGNRDGADSAAPVVSMIMSSGEAKTSPSASGPGTPKAPTKVNINSATVEQLTALPGIGPVTGQAIVDWRTNNGSFQSVEQLRDVRGIGPAKFTQVREYLLH